MSSNNTDLIMSDLSEMKQFALMYGNMRVPAVICKSELDDGKCELLKEVYRQKFTTRI